MKPSLCALSSAHDGNHHVNSSLTAFCCFWSCLQYWSAFNDWWRGIYEVSGKRPTGCDIDAWHRAHAAGVWPAGHAPSVEETRTHAKCLRSVGSIRNYFRNYRARKRVHGEQASAVRCIKVCIVMTSHTCTTGEHSSFTAQTHQVLALPYIP